ncbi:MAG: discoidin domain-containing protein, partial [Sedimentisphaerales bacterium]|nr:discoidin domain-containing protein [Sedimentisphaerales bacterium]
MINQKRASSLLRQGMAVIVCLLGVMAQQGSAARVEVAGELLVDLRSEDLAPGSVSQWPNRGSLGGVFTAGGNPIVEAVGDWANVVSLDGASYFEGPVSPSGIVGNGTRSIEVWAYNIGESKEECMVAWSHRGGPDGTNMNFNYGWKDFGAAGHWGDDADMAWQGFDNAAGGTGGYPPLETWQYLVYTYDGATIRLYVNGELNNERTVGLDTHAGDVIRIGCQNNSTSPALGEKAFTGAIAQVRIHDGALTPEQIQKNAQIRIQNSSQASDPSPMNGDPDVPLRDLVLSWEPGEYAGTHTVYFSDDMTAVEDGTAEAVSDVDVNSYDPGPVEFGRTYFWRVDEVNTPPDLTVFEGGVWSFTVEPFARTISGDSITATASSSFNADSIPQKAVDGSGLDASDQHDTTPANMWMSALGQQPPVWMQYEFDGVYKLHQMWVWNSNSALEWVAGLGVKTATIEYSTDGTTWTALANVPEFARAPGAPGYAYNTTVDFGGVAARFVKITIASNWGGVAQYGLSEVRFFSIPVLPREPHPGPGATDVPVDTTLSWRPGREAATHQVHFGTDSDAVANGTALVDIVTDPTYSLGGLNLGTTYYWRIDEVNDAATPSVWEGPVWDFTTTQYLVVDDCESYSGDEGRELFNTWIDGYNDASNGSQAGHDFPPYVEGTTVHGGRQSIPFYYGKGGASHSEVSRTLDPAQDWTGAGIKTLTLYVRGQADNV